MDVRSVLRDLKSYKSRKFPRLPGEALKPFRSGNFQLEVYLFSRAGQSDFPIPKFITLVIRNEYEISIRARGGMRAENLRSIQAGVVNSKVRGPPQLFRICAEVEYILITDSIMNVISVQPS